MSHHSDDAMLVASSDSFWEPGNYKRTTKRIEDGHRLCNDLVQLTQERSEIEKAYAKSLKTWSKKWNELIEKGPEYGTTEAAWKGVLVEAERQCDLHLKVRDKLVNDVQTQIKQWQKDNYHKSMMQLKERKDVDDAFKKAQKPWAKLLTKVNKARADYHAACKGEKTAGTQERNAVADSTVSPDQLKKMQERTARLKEDVQRARERYDAALQELNSYNAKYMEDMTQVFDRCQEMEDRRLAFFKEMLFLVHNCLNISADPILTQIYEEYRHTIQNADSSKDLKWWSNNHGVAMAMNWPQFEEYLEEFREIAGSRSKRSAIPDSSITLLNQRVVSDDFSVMADDFPNPQIPSPGTSEVGRARDNVPDGPAARKGRGDSGKTNPSITNNRLEANNRDHAKEHRVSTVSSTNSHKSYDLFQDDEDVDDKTALTESDKNGKRDGNPFDDDQEEWEEFSNDALVDNGEPGVQVKALYDYEGAEEDELSFRQGELFEKLEDEDEQGWCKGRKAGRVGLYPANYVEVVDK